MRRWEFPVKVTLAVMAALTVLTADAPAREPRRQGTNEAIKPICVHFGVLRVADAHGCTMRIKHDRVTARAIEVILPIRWGPSAPYLDEMDALFALLANAGDQHDRLPCLIDRRTRASHRSQTAPRLRYRERGSLGCPPNGAPVSRGRGRS